MLRITRGPRHRVMCCPPIRAAPHVVAPLSPPPPQVSSSRPAHVTQASLSASQRRGAGAIVPDAPLPPRREGLLRRDDGRDAKQHGCIEREALRLQSAD